MVEMTAKESSRWWWFDSHNSSKRSPWLHSTLTELDGKTKAMLKLIEEDADSFAQRAEMYYKKRPELISMVEDFYRAHRSLAERYDQMKSEIGTRLPTTFGSPFSSTKHKPQKLMNVMDQTYYDQMKSEIGTRLPTTFGSPFSSTKHKPQKLMNVMDQTYYSYSGTSDAEDYAESEVDDPEQEDVIYAENVIEEDVEDPELVNEPEVDEGPEWENEIQVDQELAEDSVSSEVCDDETMKLMEEIEEVDDPELENEAQVDQELAEDYASSGVCDDETMKLREELERLKEENLMQRNQLMQKDEEKREVIRQLSLTAGMLKDENTNLRKHIALKKQSPPCPFQFSKLKAFFMGSN